MRPAHIALIGVSVIACGSPPADPVPAPEVSSISITPQLDTIRYSELTRFTAAVHDANGNPIDSVPLWYAVTADHRPVDDRLSKDGTRFVGADSGSYIVYARIHDVIDSARLVVTLVPVRTVHVVVDSPALPDTILLRQRVKFDVELFDSVGGLLFNRVVDWSVSDRANASVDDDGIVASDHVGSLSVTALVEGVTDERTVYVRDLMSDSLATGLYHACALVASGEAWCWGRSADSAGYLNPGFWRAVPVPTRVPAPEQFVQLTAGEGHSCGLTASGGAYCWGANDSGQLGNGAWDSRRVATPVAGNLQFAELSAGLGFTCGRTTAGAIYCWGSNRYGQLGDADTVRQATPVRVAGSQVWRAVAVGEVHVCALAADGAPWCWGDNARWAQLGANIVPCEPDNFCTSPFPVATTERFVRLSAGSRATCGTTASGQTFCWGNFDLVAAHVRPLPSDPGLVQVQLDRSNNDRPCVIAGIDAAGGLWCWDEFAHRTSVATGAERLWLGNGFAIVRSSGRLLARGLNLWGQLARYDTDATDPFPLIGQH